MCGAILPLPQYVFMVWCLVKPSVIVSIAITFHSNNPQLTRLSNLSLSFVVVICENVLSDGIRKTVRNDTEYIALQRERERETCGFQCHFDVMTSVLTVN
jgi:hypothetical protein